MTLKKKEAKRSLSWFTRLVHNKTSRAALLWRYFAIKRLGYITSKKERISENFSSCSNGILSINYTLFLFEN